MNEGGKLTFSNPKTSVTMRCSCPGAQYVGAEVFESCFGATDLVNLFSIS